MTEDNALVLVAGYQDLDRAREDFDALAAQVRGKQITLRGAVLVTKDLDGNLTVIDTGDHLGRKGAGWGAGVGLVVGLFAPPMLAAAAVGAGAGALAGKFASHRITSGLEAKIGEALASGTCVVIAVPPAGSRLPVEQALGGAP